MIRLFPFLLLSILAAAVRAAPIERIWLTHALNDPARITVNWETERPTPSLVAYGTDRGLGREVGSTDLVTLHHVEIALDPEAPRHFYRILSGSDASTIHSFKGYTDETIRVGLFADRGYARDRDLSILVREDLHLLLTAGDNVASLHEEGLEGTKAFGALVDSQRDLFQTTPFMPVLGNHDREIAPRGPRPPQEAVYDVGAAAYRSFFPLPGEGWKWRLDLPSHGVGFLALDASHVRDVGTTWQTNHPVTGGSEQHRWYAAEVARTTPPFLITVNNERNATMRELDGGAWRALFHQSSAVVTGFGYFGERAEVEGFPYFNTCLKGDGDLYRDPASAFVTREDNYLLFTITKHAPTMLVEIKNLRGESLDRREIKARR